MSSRIMLVAALLLSPAIGFSLPGLMNPQALAPNQTAPRRGTADAALPEWKLGAAVTFENLTIFPVTAGMWPDTDQFITLDAGLRSGLVKITEMGAEGQQGSPAQAQSHAEVNQLSLGNHSSKPLLLLAGEMLLGGQQDRIDASDRIVMPNEKPAPLAVFCVEPGRWNGADQFGLTARAGHVASPAAGSGSSSGAGGGVGPGVASASAGGLGAGAGNGPAPAEASSGAADTRVVTSATGDGPVAGMANSKVREKAEVSKDQAQVWNSVNLTATSNMVVTRSGSLQQVYDDKKVSEHLDRYIRALKEKLGAKNIVGVVVAVDGKIQLADVFGSQSLFQAYWPKLLKSYALEALSSGGRKSAKAPIVAARSFLSAVQGEASYEGQDGVYRLTRHSSQGESSFELEYLPGGAPVLVHFNRISNK